MDHQQHIHSLFKKYLAGQCSEAEVGELLDYFLAAEEEDLLRRHIVDALNREPSLPEKRNAEIAAEEVYPRVMERLHRKRNRKWTNTLQWCVAAIFVLAAIVGMYFYRAEKQLPSVLAVNQELKDVRPEGKNATLTLAGGKKIRLSASKDGIVMNGENIQYSDGTQVGVSVPASATQNLISTPKGGQYQVILSDGTKVWLNADSELKYPSVFSGNSRVVEVAGEAYFEVSSNPGAPFFVETRAQTIQVLGTAFNISAYQQANETSTSLIAGSVRVTDRSGKALVLKPGQAAVGDNGEMLVQKVDTEEIEAWRNGYFSFNNKSIRYIMQQVARWYDVEVIYKDGVEDKVFGCVVQRSRTLADVLEIFKQADILDYKLETYKQGRRLILMNK